MFNISFDTFLYFFGKSEANQKLLLEHCIIFFKEIIECNILSENMSDFPKFLI